MVDYVTKVSWLPLTGITVLDLGRVVSAPLVTFTMAALGADVIRVDPPGGDLTWRVPPFVAGDGTLHNDRHPGAVAIGHLRRARGKRSVVLDLNIDEDRDRCRALYDQVDVVVDNVRPGSLDRLGVGPGAARARNPELIWCTISGYGATGPFASRAAIDLTVQAESGLLDRTGWPDRPGVRCGATVIDHLAASYAMTGVLAALRHRDLTGEGTAVDISMLEVATSLLWDEPLEIAPQSLERQGNRDWRGAPHGVFPAGTGRVALVVTSDKQWRALATVAGRLDLASLDRAGRLGRIDEVEQATADWTSQFEPAKAAFALSDLGISAGEVRSAIENPTHPQLIHSGFLEQLRSPTGEPTGLTGPKVPISFDGTHPTARPAEPLGQSTTAVLDASTGKGPR